MSDIYSLPEISFAEKSAEDIESAILVTYESISGRSLAAGDPVRLFLETIAAVIVQQRVLIDFTGKQNLLRYATGDYLDHIGGRVTRLPASAASTTIRFTLSAPQVGAVIIPAGTRITPDGDLYFATSVVVEIPAGELTVDVAAICMDAGTIGNGYLPGQINMLVDPIPYVEGAENTDQSSSGTDQEIDDDYRLRIWLAPESYSVAGPEGAYTYWAKTASADIIDVYVSSPSPGVVDIRPLLKGGLIPGQTILDLVAGVCSDKKVRPLTDHVTVSAPETVNYNLNLTYYIAQSRATDTISIQSAVNQAVNDYVAWQRGALGRDINPSELIARVMIAGAKRLTVETPVYTQLQGYQVAIASTVTVTYGGLENA